MCKNGQFNNGRNLGLQYYHYYGLSAYSTDSTENWLRP